MRGKKKYAWLSELMSNVLGGTREYNFNNVTYIVEPRFQSVDSNDAQDAARKVFKNYRKVCGTFASFSQ